MIGFGLLVGHLVGDYLIQNDWMAANKSQPYPGRNPWKTSGRNPCAANRGTDNISSRIEIAGRCHTWLAARSRWRIGHLACTVHCLLYTLAVAAFSWWWMPWWGLLACFLAHWPIDRFRLARVWMVRCSGQKSFATGPLAPWSIIVVDQCFHLVTLFLIALFSQGV